MFKILGSTILTSYDLCHQATLQADAQPDKQQLFSTQDSRQFEFSMIADRNHLLQSIEIDFRTDIRFTVPSITGFLNIADCNSNWNRRWCSLDQFSMQFWNYPQDSSMVCTRCVFQLFSSTSK